MSVTCLNLCVVMAHQPANHKYPHISSCPGWLSCPGQKSWVGQPGATGIEGVEGKEKRFLRWCSGLITAESVTGMRYRWHQ